MAIIMVHRIKTGAPGTPMWQYQRIRSIGGSMRNPILEDNNQSRIIVQDGDQIRMYDASRGFNVHDAIKSNG